jgi:hypothetical protein
MIMALGGRRVDAADAPMQRFPPQNEARVRAEIAALLERYRPSVLVALAAAGADMLGLEEAGRLKVCRRVILPFPPDRFRATSVVDRPGDWGARFDRLLAEIIPAGDLVVKPAPDVDESDDAAYLRVAAAVLDEAFALAWQELRAERREDVLPASRVVALAVWDGIARGEDDLTAGFIAEARARQITVEQVVTL